MVTIKQIAQETGFSLSTVSIVLRGIAQERKIPLITQQKILQTAQALGYQPNVSARRLRSDEPIKQTIAIFWATDFRATLVAQFLQGVQRYLKESSHPPMEVIVCPYTPNQLNAVTSAQTLNMYTGAIICTASTQDLQHIETLQTTCPIVLYNRVSEKFSSTCVDNNEIGKFAAHSLLKSKYGPCKTAYVIADNADLSYAKARIKAFAHELSCADIPVTILHTDDNSIVSGKKAAETIVVGNEHIGVFTSSETLCFGVLNCLHSRNISVPQQLSLITIGTSESELYQCFAPSLCSIHIPIEKMAYECTKMLETSIQSRIYTTQSHTVPFLYFDGNSI